MSRVVLVDFDGVVLRNKRACCYINKRAIQYVSKKTGISNRHILDDLTTSFYKTHGHTHIALLKNNYKSSYDEFNHFMYDCPEAKALYNDLNLSSEELESWHTFRFFCNKNNIDVKLFSNANYTWLQHFIKDSDEELYSLTNYIHNFKKYELYNTLLKPNNNIYMLTKNHLKKKYSNAYFIDDNFYNFHTIRKDTFWTNVWLNTRVDHDNFQLDENTHVINDLSAFKYLL
jgi:FMN phosphatase YigB (HAD superfamily)